MIVPGAGYMGGVLRDVGVGCIAAYAIGRATAKSTGGKGPGASFIVAGVSALAAGAVLGSMSQEAHARRMLMRSQGARLLVDDLDPRSPALIEAQVLR